MIDKLYGFRFSSPTADVLTVIAERALDKNGEDRNVTLDIWKTFDWVWNASLLHMLKGHGVSSCSFYLIQSSLSNREMRVIFNGHSSKSFCINAGAPHPRPLFLDPLSSLFSSTTFLL